MHDHEQLRQQFNRGFARWGIELPADAMSPGEVWPIVQRGWTIWMKFEIGTEDGRGRLDYYAMHRMTNDRHIRLYGDGEPEYLPSIDSSYSWPADATEAEQEALRAKHDPRNRAIEKMLEAKGFVMTADAHPSAQVNRYLVTSPPPKARDTGPD